MKINRYLPLLCLLCMLSYGCKDIVLFPVKGTISGSVTDNNGTPLPGISVSATFDEPGQTPGQASFPQTETTQTDHKGYFQLKGLWDEVLLNVQVEGFLPITRQFDMGENDEIVVDLQLLGSPTVTDVFLNKTTLSLAGSDTVVVRVEARDVYNQSGGLSYTCNVLLVNADQTTVAIVPATLQVQGLEHYLFNGLVLSEDLPSAGSYSVVVEVQDPDGHLHRTDSGLAIQAQ